jgi:hypothetical protein
VAWLRRAAKGCPRAHPEALRAHRELAGRCNDREAGRKGVDETGAERVARLDAARIQRDRDVGPRQTLASLAMGHPVDDLDRVRDTELARTIGDEARGARWRHERIRAASSP